MRKLVWLLVLAALGYGAWWAWGAFESNAPRISMRDTLIYVGAKYVQEITAVDDGRGIESMRVFISSGDKEYPLVEEKYPGDLLEGAEPNVPRSLEVSIVPKDLELPQGEATLVVEAKDYSWSSNVERVEVPLIVDSRAPRPSLLTGLTYARQGGTELAVYEINEEVSKHGIQVGEEFFPGFIHPSSPKQLLAFYALPHDASKDLVPQLVAVDKAGNRTTVPLSISLLLRKPVSDRFELSDDFLRRKVAELMPDEEGVDPLAGYLKLNTEMRAANNKKIREICAESSQERLWDSPFVQMPDSKVGAGFAAARTYTKGGKEVDFQLHLGYDLSSTSRIPVPASNDGVVVFADDLGIYGRTVILDHGLGLFSLYGHLSEITVEKGKPVAQGDKLGRSGDTGLAGGDHLHYSMMLSGVFIDPIEWFDGKWIREHIEGKLAPPPPDPSEQTAPPGDGSAAQPEGT